MTLAPVDVVDARVDSASDSPSCDGARIDERLVLSPARGRFRWTAPQNFTAEGEYVLEGQVLGVIESRPGDDVPVVSRFGGWVMNVFVRDGWHVNPGEPIASLRAL